MKLDMFKAIQESLKKSDSRKSGLFTHILRPKVGKPLVVRLLANEAAPNQTFYHYYYHGFKSAKTEKYMSVLCPTTFDKYSPLSHAYMQLWNSLKGVPKESIPKDKRELIDKLRRKSAWLVNVFVINDPENPENNGKVKILKYGIELNGIIESAISGKESEDIGALAFDLSNEGLNFEVLATAKAKGTDFITYTQSKFARRPSEIPGMTPERIREIQNELHPLQDVESILSVEELEKILKFDVFGEEASGEEDSVNYSFDKPKSNSSAPQAANAPESVSEKNKTTKTVKPSNPDTDTDTDTDDDDIEEQLKALMG